MDRYRQRRFALDEPDFCKALAFAGDDSEFNFQTANTVIASAAKQSMVQQARWIASLRSQ
jgi:hypothetical protein